MGYVTILFAGTAVVGVRASRTANISYGTFVDVFVALLSSHDHHRLRSAPDQKDRPSADQSDVFSARREAGELWKAEWKGDRFLS